MPRDRDAKKQAGFQEQLKSLTIGASSFSRFITKNGKDADIPKHHARAIDFVREGQKVNDKRLEDKIKSGKITDIYKTSTGARMKKNFNLAHDLKDGDEIELREAPFEKVFKTKDHELFGLGRTFGTVDFETGARLKARRKGDTIHIKGTAEKGFEDIYDFSEDYILHGKGKPFKIRSRWEHPFKATLVVKDNKVDSSFFMWEKDE